MSEKPEEQKITIAAGNSELTHCPLCRAPFDNPIATNVKHQCPPDAGCGRYFLVRVYD